MNTLYPNTAMRCNIIITFILVQLTFIMLPKSTFAQQYFIQSYGAENGLPTRIITDACQDKKGYMWFSTYYGISKYDGFSFTNFDSLSGLAGQHYRKIRCDEKGIIWAVPGANSGKIVFFTENKWNTINLPYKEKPSSYITSFDVTYKSNSPVLCIGTNNGLYVYQNNTWKQFNISDNLSENNVYSVVKKNNLFYLGTEVGLCVFNGEKLDWSLNAEINPKNESILSVTFEKPDLPWERMWILTSHSISYLQNKKIINVAENFLLEYSDDANSPFIGIRRGGSVIFGNNFSKYILNISEHKIIPLRIKNGFTSNGASSLFIDREENIWFSDSRGINKLSDVSLVSYFETSGMPENEVTAIAETNDGRFVLGHNNQISILHDTKFKAIPFPGTQNSLTRVLDMIKDNSGNIWFSANNLGIGRLMPNDAIKWYPFVKGLLARSVCQDKDGRIWIGTNRKLCYLENDKIVEYEHNNMIVGGERKIFPCFKGGIYISGMNGLWHVDKSGAVKIKVDAASQDLNVFAYYRDKKGTEFVGAMNGLYYINKGVITRFSHSSLKITNPIYFILQDRENSYWFGTNNGVFKWNGINEPEIFNPLNGLAGRETNRSAGLLDSKGMIWVGTDRGLSCFSPGNEQSKTPAPVVNLLYAESIYGDQYPLNENASVSYTNNTISFHFRGISYVNEELLSYKYKLAGYDKGWREADQAMLDKIKYIDLNPGTYNLCVMAKNNSGEWSKEVRSADIIIRPPFYLTWWFIILSILIFLGGLLIVYKISSQQLINKTLKKEISERKLAEQNLKESEQRLSFIIEGSRLGTWDWDLRKNVIERNHLWAEMLGYDLSEIEQTPSQFLDLLHPDDKTRAWSELQKHLEGKTALYEVEYRMRTKDNQYKWIHDQAKIVLRDTDGKPTRMSGTHTDITERKHAADALQNSEERLRLLLASLPVVIFIAPVDGNFNPEMVAGNVETLTGYTEQECLSGSHFWQRVHPDDLDSVLAAFKHAPSNEGITIEYRWKVADGTYKWFHNQTIVTTNDSRQEYLGVFVDINDLKEAEQLIRNKNVELSLLNAEKDKLFSIISHDLRSPVSGFLGLTELMGEELGRISPAQLREIIAAMHTSAGKVNDLLNDLLEWSRLQRGLTIFAPVVLNLKQTADECIDLVTEQSKAKNITVINEIPGEMEIAADVHMLEVVLRNLLSNAVKFTPKKGKVIISASSENQLFTRISISDTGLGMNSDLQSKLFKVNEKTSRKGTEGEPSSGLGLILCWEFVEKQNGKIWVESVEGEGSTFHFTVMKKQEIKSDVNPSKE